MSKEKKTALDLACEHFTKEYQMTCGDCPLLHGCKRFNTLAADLHREKCTREIKQYFQKQADIPDVLVIVKNKYSEYAKKYDKLLEKYNLLDKTNGFKNEESRKFMRIELNSYADKANVLGDIMKEAGIEV